MMADLPPEKEPFRVRLRARLRRIQRAPEPQRKRWLVTASFAAMVMVVGLWVLYLNLTVPRAAGWDAEAPVAAAEGTDEASGGSVEETLERGFSAIADEFTRRWDEARENMTETFEGLKGAIERENQFTFEAATGTPPSAATLPPVPPVPPAPLPEAPGRATGTISQ